MSKLYDAVSAPVAATRDGVSKRLKSIRDTVTLYYNKAKELLVPQRTLQDEVEKVAMEDYVGMEDIKHMYGREKERKKNTEEEGDVQYLFDGHDMRLVEEGRQVKTWQITKQLNKPLTDTVMWKATPDINMRTKVVYSFKCWIYRGSGEVALYHKTKSSNGTFSSLSDITAFIEECERKRLDLDDNEFWSKAYLPAERTIETPGSYEGKVVFEHVQIKFITTNEPLLGCGPLPDWLRKKRCIYAVDGKDERTDNLCVWRCLAIYTRRDVARGTEFLTREALKLAREYYENDTLKRQEVRATRLVDFEGIAKKFNVNIRVYEPKSNLETAPWMLVYGKRQYKVGLDTINLGMFGGHCFYIKKMDVLCQKWECVACQQVFTQSTHLNRHLTDGSCNGGQPMLICNGGKFKRLLNATEKVFYGGKPNFSYSACQWIEHMSEVTGKHIHHALCGHGGERVIRDSNGKEQYKVDGYEPITETVYQYHGCKWHGCPCQENRSNTENSRYTATKSMEDWIKKRGYNVVSVWECEKPLKKKQFFKVQFRAYPHYVVFDFEALLEVLNDCRTSDLTYTLRQTPVSVAICDTLTRDPSFIVHEDPKELIRLFVEELKKRQKLIVEDVEEMYPKPDDFDMLPDTVQKEWERWVNQVPVIGFNSGKYDLNLIKRYFVEEIAKGDEENKAPEIFVARKDNNYMFLTTDKYKFLDIRNYLAPVLSYDAWCKSLGCKLEKLVFPYEWLTSYEKLSHVGPVKRKAFYSRLEKKTISRREYRQFRREFYKRKCVTMLDWLREYNVADVEPFIEAVDKTREQYYKDGLDLLKDAVSIPGLSQRYVLNKGLKTRPECELYAPGEPCKHKCEDTCFRKSCKACKEVRDECQECGKNQAYELLRTGMVGGPAIVFTRYHRCGKTRIRSHEYGRNGKKCKTILGYDANALYLYCSGQDMPCGKERLEKVKSSKCKRNIQRLNKKVLDGSLFGFAQVDVEVPSELYEKFSEMSPFFVVDKISEVPEDMKKYREETGRKVNENSRKLLGVMKTEKILLYTPLLKWYLEHGLKVTAYHQLLHYKRGRPFDWFPEEVAGARRQADKDKDKKIAGDTAKLKGNSFYGKMIEDVARHCHTTFTVDDGKVDAAMRSPFFEDLEEIGDAFEIKERKRKVKITRPYQCGIAVYQLAKLRMLEFYYDFLDKYIDRRDFEYVYMDTDSAYFAISGEELRDMVKPELLEEYDRDVKNWLATDKYSERTPGLFKPEFIGSKMIALSAKCYFAEGKQGTKYSCKGMSKTQNDLNWRRYMNVFQGSLDKAQNIGFRVHGQGVVTYEQNKLGLSAYYDKRYVLKDGIDTRPLKM